jgi:hypothetical protein
MRYTSVTTTAIVLGVVLAVGASPSHGADAHGQVVGIDIERCRTASGDCEGRLVLALGEARTTVPVTPATTIVRAGRSIALAEVGLGNVVAILGEEHGGGSASPPTAPRARTQQFEIQAP